MKTDSFWIKIEPHENGEAWMTVKEPRENGGTAKHPYGFVTKDQLLDLRDDINRVLEHIANSAGKITVRQLMHKLSEQNPEATVRGAITIERRGMVPISVEGSVFGVDSYSRDVVIVDASIKQEELEWDVTPK